MAFSPGAVADRNPPGIVLRLPAGTGSNLLHPQGSRRAYRSSGGDILFFRVVAIVPGAYTCSRVVLVYVDHSRIIVAFPAGPVLFPVWMRYIYDGHRSSLMTATEFIPVSQKTYEEISSLLGPDRTFDEIIANLVEQAKKQQLEDDVEAILARNRFVEI